MKRIAAVLRKLNNISTKKKLLISYILLVFIPVLVVGIVLTGGMRKMALDQAVNEAVVNVERLEKNIAGILKVPSDFSDILYVDETLKAIVTSRFADTEEVVRAYWQYTKFDDYMRIYKSIEGITLYNTNDTLIDNWRFMKTTPEISESEWYREAVGKKGGISWGYIYNNHKKESYLSLTRMLGTTGVLVINMNSRYLNSIIENEPFETIVADEKGYIVMAKNAELIGHPISILNFDDEIINNDSGIYETGFQNRTSKVIVDSFYPDESRSKFKIFCAFPVDSILKSSYKTSFLGFSVITASLLVSLVFITLFSNILSKRIRRLSADVHRVATGDFDASPEIGGNDEIGQLSKDLNAMTLSIKRLLEQVEEANMQKQQILMQKNQLEIKQREIKLKMLANQINPHFLFNVLETIHMKVDSGGDTETADIIALLGKLMRRNLEIGSELAAISDEIDTVKSYLEIQRFRYGDRISYSINVDDEVKSYRILPLIIQPIVENAVVHGLENMKGNGVISVDIRKEGSLLMITVIDNGLGIDEAKLERLKESLNEAEDDAGKRIGLKNVHQRIKLHYGNEYGLKITSALKQGTRVDITIPLNGECLC